MYCVSHPNLCTFLVNSNVSPLGSRVILLNLLGFAEGFSESVPKLHARPLEDHVFIRNHGIHHQDQLSPLDPHTSMFGKTSCPVLASSRVHITDKFHSL